LLKPLGNFHHSKPNGGEGFLPTLEFYQSKPLKQKSL
jgi:hypothetical protein